MNTGSTTAFDIVVNNMTDYILKTRPHRVAVIITCYNRREKTLACLRNLFRQTGIETIFSLGVYLVDDGSTDGTGAAVSREFSKINLIQGDGSLYWNRGMHTAWLEAEKKDYDYYLWLNDDTNIYGYAITSLLQYAMETNNQAVICSSIESPEVPGLITYGGQLYASSSTELNYPGGKLLPCDVINGNCVLVPRNVFKVVGNLDWVFIHAIGDYDYGQRAKKRGFQVLSTGIFIGACSKNPTLPKWCLPNVPFFKRIKSLYSPLGNSQPFRYFIYEKRHFGMLVAIKHFISIHIRVLVPTLWK